MGGIVKRVTSLFNLIRGNVSATLKKQGLRHCNLNGKRSTIPCNHEDFLHLRHIEVTEAVFRTFLSFTACNYNHGQKSWDRYTVRTLFNTREIVSARY